TWGTGGTARINAKASRDAVMAVGIDANNEIVAIGDSRFGGTSMMKVSPTGVVTPGTGGGSIEPRGVARTPKGDLVVAGGFDSFTVALVNGAQVSNTKSYKIAGTD